MGRVVQMHRPLSLHHDAAAPWAREPRLTPVVEIKRTKRMERRRLVIEIAAIAFGAGWVVRELLKGVLG